MELLFSADFTGVRVVVDPLPAALGARAFAYGETIHFAPGEYQPGTAEGWQVIGHELAHVLQQRQGRVPLASTSGARVPLVNDAHLEEEASQAGYAARLAFSDASTLRSFCVAPNSTPARQATHAVQCLMKVEEFRKLTEQPSSGAVSAETMAVATKLTPIDSSLRSYHQTDVPNAINRKGPRDYPKLLALTKTMLADCVSFKAVFPKNSAITGVEKLMQEIKLEQPVLTPLAKFTQEQDDFKQWEHLEDAQETYLRIKDNPEFNRKGAVGEINDLLDFEMAKMGPNNAEHVQGLAADTVTKDFESLRDLANRPSIPSVIAQIIRETTATTNVAQLNWAVGRPGAFCNRLNPKKGPAKYTLTHMLSQAYGKPFRLGSLLHELTHISIAETFDNTAIMLAIDKQATDDQMVELANKRKANIITLQKTIHASDLLDWQKRELVEKSEYAVGDKFSQYVGLLKAYNTDMVQYARLDNLVKTKGLKSELVEYDTVINQMLLWCYLWHVNQTKLIFTQLLAFAEEAYKHRLNGAVKWAAPATVPNTARQPRMQMANTRLPNTPPPLPTAPKPAVLPKPTRTVINF